MNNKVNSFGFSSLVLSLSSSAFYGTFSSYILYKTKTDSFITIIIGFIISLILSKIILSLFNKYPNKSFYKRNKQNKITNIFIIILSFLTYLLLCLRLSTFLSNQYLINTPNYIILSMILLITFYISSKGLPTITRVSIITSIISIIIFIFDFTSLITQIKLDNFYPMFITNIKDILTTSLLFSIYYITPIFFLNSFKKNHIIDKNNFNKYYYIMLFTSLIIILTNMFTTIGVMGIDVDNLFDYPIYTTLKRIHLFSFLDSIENISIMLWILFIINSCNINLYFINNLLKELFHLNKTKSFIINIILLSTCLISSLVIFNDGFIESYDYIIFPSIISSLLIFIQITANIKERLIQ